MKYWLIVKTNEGMKRFIHEDVNQPLDMIEEKFETLYPELIVAGLGYGTEFPNGFQGLPLLQLEALEAVTEEKQ